MYFYIDVNVYVIWLGPFLIQSLLGIQRAEFQYKIANSEHSLDRCDSLDIASIRTNGEYYHQHETVLRRTFLPFAMPDCVCECWMSIHLSKYHFIPVAISHSLRMIRIQNVFIKLSLFYFMFYSRYTSHSTICYRCVPCALHSLRTHHTKCGQTNICPTSSSFFCSCFT